MCSSTAQTQESKRREQRTQQKRNWNEKQKKCNATNTERGREKERDTHKSNLCFSFGLLFSIRIILIFINLGCFIFLSKVSRWLVIVYGVFYLLCVCIRVFGWIFCAFSVRRRRRRPHRHEKTFPLIWFDLHGVFFISVVILRARSFVEYVARERSLARTRKTKCKQSNSKHSEMFLLLLLMSDGKNIHSLA